ncbi:MAG: amidohydrolase family protein [Dehalococcoidia bacterium]
MKRIDSHLHVWADDPARYPYRSGSEPKVPADAELLLRLMDESGVDGALIVQPIVHGFDHTYVNETLARWPDRFTGMALIDPRDEDPPALLEQLILKNGYRGVRLNPRLWPEGRHMDDEIGDALFKKAGDLGIAVGFLIDPANFDQVDALCSEYPDTTAIIDHFGHCRPSGDQSSAPEFERLIELARHPRLHVKLSEFPRASRQEWPFEDMYDWVHRLIGVYGADRLMWGTDFPFIVEQAGYARGWDLAECIQPKISPADLELILGGTAMSVFGGWR